MAPWVSFDSFEDLSSHSPLTNSERFNVAFPDFVRVRVTLKVWSPNGKHENDGTAAEHSRRPVSTR
jgi:hypothetical protein